MINKIPTYEKTFFGALLTMAAGGIDAYSYIFHGQVFAGLQTGNMILLGVNLGQGHWSASLRYIISILAFFVGTIIIRIMQRSTWSDEHENGHRKLVLIYEAVLLLIIAGISQFVPSIIATILLSITAAAELQEFRRLNGGPFTPLMMTGNLRTLAETSFDALIFHETAAVNKLKTTASIMVTFIIGAALIAISTPIISKFSIVIPAIVILIALSSLYGSKDE